MSNTHLCVCAACTSNTFNPTKHLHALMNLFLQALDQRQRGLYVGLEAIKRGPGSEKGLSLIFGWDQQAIAVARRDAELEVERQGGLESSKGEPHGPQREDDVERGVREKMARAMPMQPVHEKTAGPMSRISKPHYK